MLNAAEFELDCSHALASIRKGGFSDKRYGYNILHKITLDETHKDRLEAASYIIENLEVDFDNSYLNDAWENRQAQEKSQTLLALIEDDARVALHAIAKNDPTPWKQQLAAKVLYKKYYRHSGSELQGLNTEPLRKIVKNNRHPEQYEAAITVLDVNKILNGSSTEEEDVRLALSGLVGITQGIDHKDRFKSAVTLWNVWNFGLREEDRYLTQHFIPVFVDVVKNPNDSNGFEASSKLLHLYEHGQNVNEAHKSLALEGLRRTIRNPNDPNQDNAAMYLGNTTIRPKYNRAGESKVRLAADLSLSYGVLYVSAEDERNPNQLQVLRWLCRNAPQDLRDIFYGILKELAERDTTGITDGHFVHKIDEARKVLREVDESRTSEKQASISEQP